VRDNIGGAKISYLFLMSIRTREPNTPAQYITYIIHSSPVEVFNPNSQYKFHSRHPQCVVFSFSHLFFGIHSFFQFYHGSFARSYEFHNLLIFSSCCCNTTHKFLIFYVILNLLNEDPTSDIISGVSIHNLVFLPFSGFFFFSILWC
jgi:hypothetical protein